MQYIQMYLALKMCFLVLMQVFTCNTKYNDENTNKFLNAML